MKKKKVHNALKDYQDFEMPFHVKRILVNCSGKVYLAGDQASLGEDYGTIEELRHATEWLVDQFGGKVKWN